MGTGCVGLIRDGHERKYCFWHHWPLAQKRTLLARVELPHTIPRSHHVDVVFMPAHYANGYPRHMKSRACVIPGRWQLYQWLLMTPTTLPSDTFYLALHDFASPQKVDHGLSDGNIFRGTQMGIRTRRWWLPCCWPWSINQALQTGTENMLR